MMSAIAMRAKRVALRSRPRLPAMSRVRAFATLETTTPSSAPRALGREGVRTEVRGLGVRLLEGRDRAGRVRVLGRVAGRVGEVHVRGVAAGVLEALVVADAVGSGERDVEDARHLATHDARLGGRGGAGVDRLRDLRLGVVDERLEVVRGLAIEVGR